MIPTYNGWEDTPEDEREALDLWEAADLLMSPSLRKSRASQAVIEIYVDGAEGAR